MGTKTNNAKAYALMAVVAVVAAGCAAQQEQVVTTPVTTIQILVDPTVGVGHPITVARVLDVVEQATTITAATPGATLEVHLLAEDVGSTALIYSATTPPPGRVRAKRLVASQRQRFVREVLDSAGLALATALRQPPPRQSPLLAAVSKVTLHPRGDGEAILVVLSDGLVVADDVGISWECGPMDREEALRVVDREGWLRAGSLERYAIHLAFFDAGPVPDDRCPMTIRRRTAVDALWTYLLTDRAGARAVHITSGAPVLATPSVGGGRS